MFRDNKSVELINYPTANLLAHFSRYIKKRHNKIEYNKRYKYSKDIQ